MNRVESTLIVPTSTNWEVEREGGTEKFIRSMAREASRRLQPLQILSTGTNTVTSGSVVVRPVVRNARTELAYVRALRRNLRARVFPIPDHAVVLANAEHYVWPFLDTHVPVMLLAHGAVPPTLRRTGGLLMTLAFELLLERRAIQRADRILVVSKNTEAYYRKKFPEASRKVALIPMGVDLDAIPSPETRVVNDRSEMGHGRPRVLFAGRLSKEKGLPLIVRACSIVRAEGERKSLELTVAGDGPLRGWLQDRCRSTRWIHALGRVPHSELMELMVRSDLLTIGSSYEGLPTVLLEALCAGLPIVSTNVGRARELLGRESGVVVERTPGDFAEGIVRASKLDRLEAAKAGAQL